MKVYVVVLNTAPSFQALEARLLKTEMAAAADLFHDIAQLSCQL